MNKEMIRAKVIKDGAIIKNGTRVVVQDGGNNHFLVIRSNGQKIPSTWTLWLKADEIEIESRFTPTAASYKMTKLEAWVWKQPHADFADLAIQTNRTVTAIEAAYARAKVKAAMQKI